MPIAKQKAFELAPAGTHIARCFACIGLGTQPSEIYRPAEKVLLMWELPHERIQIEGEDKPLSIFKEYTLNLGSKASLGQDLVAWRKRPFTAEELKGFNVEKVVGVPCQLTITHKPNAQGDMKARVESVTAMAKGMICPDQENPSLVYDITQGRDSTFSSLPDWIKKKIEACEEWQPKPEPAQQPIPASPSPVGEVEEDDVPF